LLALALQRQQLSAPAAVALDAELAVRSQGEGALRELENRLRAEVEPELEVIEDESPPPSELPDDWFDGDTDSPPASLASSRPKGVTVGAFVFWLSGTFNAASGVLMISAGMGDESRRALAAGALTIALGLLQFVTGFGLWSLHSWGRKLGEVLCWLSAIFLAVSIVSAAVIRLRGSAANPAEVFWQLLGCLWQLLWAIYLGRKSTREAFLPVSQQRRDERLS
jgi:hypothetical protein